MFSMELAVLNGRQIAYWNTITTTVQERDLLGRFYILVEINVFARICEKKYIQIEGRKAESFMQNETVKEGVRQLPNRDCFS